VAVADFDHDGKPDIAVSNGHDNTISVLRNDSVSIGLAPFFAQQQTFATSFAPNYLAVADFNGDGKPDMVVANTNCTTVSVLLNTSSGSGLISFATHQDIDTFNAPAGLVVADFNGDGKPDLAVISSDNSSITVMLNTTPTGNSTVSFSNPMRFPAAVVDQFTAALTLTTADVNGDGKPDLITADQNHNTVGILLNRTSTNASTPDFAQFATLPSVGGAPWSVAAGNVTGNGPADVITTNFNQGTISVLANDTTIPGAGDPSFLTHEDLKAGPTPWALTLGDFNGDGKLDVAVSNTFNSSVSILPNTSQPVSLSTGTATGTIQDDDAPATLTIMGVASESAAVNTAFTPVTVLVRNAAGNPVSNATITFQAPTNGPSGTFANGQTTITDVSNSSGLLTEAFKANSQGGSYNVTVTTPTVAQPVTFSLTNANTAFPAPPVLTGPTTADTNTKPTIAWNAVAGASTYELWVNNNSASQNPVIDVAGLTTTSLTPIADLPPGSYTAWVRAFDAQHNATAWDSSLTFIVLAPNAPVLTAPTSPPTTTRPTLSWNAVTEAPQNA
jgi:hypothetical protein